SRPGGRLSTTNQPRSSRHLAAVLRPAPDIPVSMVSSGATGCSALAVTAAPLRSPLLADPAGKRDRLGGFQDDRISPVATLTAGAASGVAASAATIASAVRGPMPGTSPISATVAARRRLSDPNRLRRAV